MPVGRALQSLGARGRSEGGAGFPALLGAVVPQARVDVRRRVSPCLQAAVTPKSSKGPQPSPLDLGENGTEREGEMSERPAHSCASWSSGSCAMWGQGLRPPSPSEAGWDCCHPMGLGQVPSIMLCSSYSPGNTQVEQSTQARNTSMPRVSKFSKDSQCSCRRIRFSFRGSVSPGSREP